MSSFLHLHPQRPRHGGIAVALVGVVAATAAIAGMAWCQISGGNAPNHGSHRSIEQTDFWDISAAVAQALSGGASSRSAIVNLRALGPQVLAILDHARATAPDLATADRWNQLYDQVAAQRDASVSRLYWYTDLHRAQLEAIRSHRPILSLRLLGALTDEFSCANSRLFRAVLYPDPMLSAYLRDHCVLFWSSERPVPQVSIDLGDGHILHQTLGGNSIHYLLDEDLEVLDAFPGLYTPQALLDGIMAAVDLHERIRQQPSKRRQLLMSYHQQALVKRTESLLALNVPPAAVTLSLNDPRTPALDAFTRASAGSIVPDPIEEVGQIMSLREQPPFHGLLLNPALSSCSQDEHSSGNTVADAISAAELLTFSKSLIETPILRGVGLGDPSMKTLIPDQILKELSGRYSCHLSSAGLQVLERQMAEMRDISPHPLSRVLMQAQLQVELAKDTVLDEVVLHAAIHDYLISHPVISMEACNSWIYKALFHTPKSDAWLGLMPTHLDGIDHHIER